VTGLGAYDQYLYAAAAMFGTFLAALGTLWALQRPRWAQTVGSYHGVAPPFINIIGVLFALTLAFLANDTWGAHDRAIDAVNREADALRSVLTLVERLPPQAAAPARAAVEDYARAVAAEWPLLARRSSSPEAAAAAERLLGALADRLVVEVAPGQVHQLMLQQAVKARDAREARIALSKTHVNPLKWLGMAFLGFVTMLSVAAVHIGQPRAALAAIMLFAVAAGPTAAIVLVHGNPFQQPTSVTSAPITALLR
jgi:hypothetical protein